MKISKKSMNALKGTIKRQNLSYKKSSDVMSDEEKLEYYKSVSLLKAIVKNSEVETSSI